MENCWEHSPDARHKMRDTWKSLAEFAKSENPYENDIKGHARYLATLQRSAAPQKCLRVSLKSCQQFVNISSGSCGDSTLQVSSTRADSNECTSFDATITSSLNLSETDSARNSLDSVASAIQKIESDSSVNNNCTVPQDTTNSCASVECRSRIASVIERLKRGIIRLHKKVLFIFGAFIMLIFTVLALYVHFSIQCTYSVRFIHPEYDLYIVPYNDSSNFTVDCKIEELDPSFNIFWRKVTTSGYVILPLSSTSNPSEYQVFSPNGIGAELVLTNVVSSNFYECVVDIPEKNQEYRKINTCITLTKDSKGNSTVSSNQTLPCGVPHKIKSSVTACIISEYAFVFWCVSQSLLGLYTLLVLAVRFWFFLASC